MPKMLCNSSQLLRFGTEGSEVQILSPRPSLVFPIGTTWLRGGFPRAPVGRPVRVRTRRHPDAGDRGIQHAKAGPPISTGGYNNNIQLCQPPGYVSLLYEFTVADPTIWVSRWTAQMTMKKNPDLIYEFACHEGNYGLYNILAGSRSEEAALAARAEESR